MEVIYDKEYFMKKEFFPILNVVDKYADIYAKCASGDAGDVERLELNFISARFAESLIQCLSVENVKELSKYILNNIWRYEI